MGYGYILHKSAYQIGQCCVFTHHETDSGGCDKLLPMAISNGGVLKLTDCSQ